jgi:hypothetical protein
MPPAVTAMISPVVFWHGPHDAVLMVNVLPMALPVEMLQKQLAASSAMAGSTVVSGRQATACGSPAAIMTLKSPGAKKEPVTSEVRIEEVDGKTVLVTSSRSAAAAADPAIEETISGLCDLSNAATLAPPKGWSALHLAIVGEWMGASPMDVMVLMTTDPAPTLSDALKTAQLAQNQGTQAKDAAAKATPTTLCGLPALHVSTTTSTAATGKARVDAMITQNAAHAYILSYSRPVGTADDPAVMASLGTLCAKEH